MPVKIGFHVISASGEDEKYRAAELNYHGPTVKGWRSEVGSTFPQEILLQLKVLTILQKIQILSHQYLIPQKIEICTSLSLGKNKHHQNFSELFQNLGFITFSDNKATGFRSRELKSVFIPHIKAKYVKLVIHDNYVNIKNIFNQVSLIGINIIGEQVQRRLDEDEVNKNVSRFSYSFLPYEIINSSNYMSPYDDLAFEMYVDEETATIIKKIEYKKHQAIFEENFDFANTLKFIIENLRAAGEIIGLYEQEKRQAIQFEDYDKAKSKKFQIDNFRQKVYTELCIDELLQSEKIENKHYEKGKLVTFYETESFKNKTSFNDNPNKFLNLKSEFDDSNNSKKISEIKSECYRLHTCENSNSNTNIIQSKSQTLLSLHKNEPSPSEFYKKQAVPKSLSIPYLNPYLKRKQPSNYEKSKTSHSSEMISSIETPSTSQYSEEDEPILSSSTEVHSSNFKSEKKISHLKETSISMPNSEGVHNDDKTHDSVDSSKRFIRSNISITSEKLLGNFTESEKKKLTKSESKNGMTHTTKSSFQIYEDSMLPALKNYQKNEVFRECQLLIEKQVKTTLNEREKKQAMLPISVFGIEMVEKFYSKSFTDKEEGLKELQLELKRMANIQEGNDNNTRISYNKIARAALFLLQRALRDSIYSVYSKATETIRQFFKEFAPQRVSQSEIAKSVEKLFPELLSKSGDVTPRIHNMAAHTLLSISECEEVRRLHIISSRLSRPLTSSVHPRLALSRLEMVEQLMINQGISKNKRSGLTCRTLAEFGSSGLHHPAEAVRKVSERILLQVYKVNPKIVRKQLPPDDNVTRRNLLYRQLFQEFDSMDSKNTSTNNEKITQSITENKKITTKEKDALILTKTFDITSSSDKTVKQKQFHLNLQTQTSKQHKLLHLGENRKIMMPPGNYLNKFPSESKNKYQSMSGIKGQQTSMQFNCYLSKGNLKSNHVAPTIKRTKNEILDSKKKTVSNVAGNKNPCVSSTSRLKFPNLTDSIDVATVRILLNKDTNKNIRSKKGENNLTFTETEPRKESASYKEIKRNRHTSNIPISIFHFKKYCHANVFKKSLDKPIKQCDIKKNKNDNQEILSETLKINYEPLGKNRFLKTESDQIQTLQNLKNNNKQITTDRKKHNLKEEYRTQKIHLTNKIETEESYRFSDSMLASIRDNEFTENNFLRRQKDQNGLKSCIFCLSPKKWATEVDLNEHYLNDCPMLMACEYCMEIVEISGYTNHLLDECDQKHLFKKCLKCLQAVLEDFYNNHECRALHLKKNKTRCLFCHSDLTDDESSWRKHLMGGNKACSNHPRNIAGT